MLKREEKKTMMFDKWTDLPECGNIRLRPRRKKKNRRLREIWVFATMVLMLTGLLCTCTVESDVRFATPAIVLTGISALMVWIAK